MTTLEEVFLKIGEDDDDEEAQAHKNGKYPIGTKCLLRLFLGLGTMIRVVRDDFFRVLELSPLATKS